MKFVALLVIAALLWLACFSLVGLAVYIHYFTDSSKDIGPLLIAAVVFGWLAIVGTGAVETYK